MNEPSKPGPSQGLQRRPSKKSSVPHMRPVHNLKDALAVILISTICLFAVIQKMEFLAVAAMLCIGAIVYKTRARQAVDIAYQLLSRARAARIGEFELTVEQRVKDYSRLLTQQMEWIRVILSDMTSVEISLLLAVHRAGRYEARESQKNVLRSLRGRGLLHHNAPSMGASTEVWLSEFGKEVASHLLKVKAPQDIPPTSGSRSGDREE